MSKRHSVTVKELANQYTGAAIGALQQPIVQMSGQPFWMPYGQNEVDG